MPEVSNPGYASISDAPAARKPLASTEVTPVGVDVGTTDLVTVTTAEAGPTKAISVAGDRVRDLYTDFTRATHSLDKRAECLGDVVARFWPRFQREFRQAGDAVLEYTRNYDQPVVALEAFDHGPAPLVKCAYGGLKPSHWIPPVVHRVVADRVVAAGLPVAYVNRHHTTQECHQCGEIGSVEFGEIVCASPECPVYAVDKDASAAVTIAKRAGGVAGD